MDAQSYFLTPLVDLGTVNPAFRGVLSPREEIASEKLGITSQFLENAEDYAARYASTAYFRGLLERGLALAGGRPENPSILDLGTGSGANSVFPALDIFGSAEIVGTDLSPNLLAMLQRETERRGLTRSVASVAVDAMRDYFRPEAFDLVIGAAILHHLFDPAGAVRAAFRALKPGGAAIFFEPFELGQSILTLTFERIMAENNLRGGGLDPLTLHFMHLYTGSIRMQLGRDKSAPAYREIDDKWLFSETYFQEVAQAIGFDSVAVQSIHDPNGQTASRADALLSLTTGRGLDGLPEWARAIVHQVDGYFSEARRELIHEGIVVLRKGA